MRKGFKCKSEAQKRAIRRNYAIRAKKYKASKKHNSCKNINYSQVNSGKHINLAFSNKSGFGTEVYDVNSLSNGKYHIYANVADDGSITWFDKNVPDVVKKAVLTTAEINKDNYKYDNQERFKTK